MAKIRTYDYYELETKKFMLFADIANRKFMESKVGFYVDIADTYFDLGQDWKYTTLITERLSDGSTWQSFCPRDWEKIVDCDSFKQIEEWAIKYANGIINGEFCVDL